MENTKENVIKLLDLMLENRYNLIGVNDRNEDSRLYTEIIEIDTIRSLLTDNEYFNSIWNVYNKRC